MKLINTNKNNKNKIMSYIGWWIKQELTVMYCLHKLSGPDIVSILNKKLSNKLTDMIMKGEIDEASYIFVVHHPFIRKGSAKCHNVIYVAMQVLKNGNVYSITKLYELDRLSI